MWTSINRTWIGCFGEVLFATVDECLGYKHLPSSHVGMLAIFVIRSNGGCRCCSVGSVIDDDEFNYTLRRIRHNAEDNQNWP